MSPRAKPLMPAWVAIAGLGVSLIVGYFVLSAWEQVQLRKFKEEQERRDRLDKQLLDRR